MLGDCRKIIFGTVLPVKQWTEINIQLKKKKKHRLRDQTKEIRSHSTEQNSIPQGLQFIMKAWAHFISWERAISKDQTLFTLLVHWKNKPSYFNKF